MEIEDHYALLLGIHSPWEISSVQLSMTANRVDIVVEYSDTSGVYPECGVLSPKHYDRESRTWRHLHASLPRVQCKTHAVKMLKSHLNGLLNYFHHRISNAVAEGLNSKIQTVKSNARGYRSFEGFRTSILFYCGKLDMLP